MSVAYDVYAEICIKGKWFGINPIIQDGDGDMVAVPILGWEQSWFRQSYEAVSYTHLTLPTNVNV